MLRIINSFNHRPQTFKIDPVIAFNPGMIGQLTVINNQVMATISNGISPIGIIDDVRNDKDDSTVFSKVMTIWMARAIVRTDQYEREMEYPINGNLYCSEYGLFTTRRPSPLHPAIGMVMGMEDKQLELLWY